MVLVVTSGFPRDMPETTGGILPFDEATFDTLYTQSSAPTRGGQAQVVNLGPDLWSMRFSTKDMGYEDALDYQAWAQSLRGGARLFKAWHPLLRYPISYRNGFGGLTRAGGGTFDGTCTLTTIGAARDSITLTNLPVGFSLKRGDMVSFPMGASQTLHRVMAAATASAGGSVTLTIEPIVPLAAVTGVTATFFKPWCLAVIDAQSIKGPLSAGQIGSLEFSAVQTF